MNKLNKIAFRITTESIKTKDDFLEFLLGSIKTIHFIFGDNDVITASKKEEDLDLAFIKLKKNVSDWMNESSHAQPFYPRDFVKKILKKNVIIDYALRPDNPDKMKPEDYGLDSAENIKKFILSRIDNNNEINGLKFKENKMFINDGEMPLDVYNAITFNIKKNKDTRIYLKFRINKEFSDAYFNMTFISIHEDINQK